MKARVLIATALMATAGVSASAEQTLGDKIKKIFASPTPVPTPHKKKKIVAKPKSSPEPSASPNKKRKGTSPTPSATPKQKSSPRPKKKTAREPTATPSPSASVTPSPSPEEPEKRGAPNATLATDRISGFADYPTKVQNLLTSALALTTRNLDYKYGSADPGNGGMDCSGFVYFVLRENGIADVPRDSSEQYIWLRRAGTFEPVLSNKEDSFEFENLKPGDLLFWTGTYAIERDPPITHAMIYLGREKKTGVRVMVGASDGRTYQGQQRFGVSVFDFKMPKDKGNGDRPRFVGYGHIPGLKE